MNLLTSVYQITSKTVATVSQQPWTVKLFWILCASFAPLKDYVLFLIFLLIVDAITSIYYQFRKRVEAIGHRSSAWDKIKLLFTIIESNKLRRTFEKMVAYVLGLIVFFKFDQIILQLDFADNVPLHYFSTTNIAVLMICSVEVYSITENLSKITKNPIFTAIGKVFKRRVEEQIKSERSVDEIN